MMPGLVSVVIPTYNRYETTIRAIESVFKQTYKHYEIIVCDDQSMDDSYKKLITKYSNDKRVYVCRDVGIKGANAARLIAVNHSHGEYIAFLDSDDQLTEKSIESRIEILKKESECMMVYGDSVGEDGKINRHDAPDGEFIDAYLYEELSLCEYGTIMLRRRCFEDGMIIDTDIKSWQDDDMVLSVNRLYSNNSRRIQHCGTVVLQHNYSPNSITNNREKLYQGIRKIVSKYKKEIIGTCGYRRYVLWEIRVLHRYCNYRYEGSGILARKIWGTIGGVAERVYKNKFRHV